MSKTKTKRYLMLLAAIGLVAAALGGTGTFASFTAETTNGGNTFATGTLLLANTVNSVTCNSNSSAANTATCNSVFTASNLGTGVTQSNTVTVSNTGTLTASALTLFGSPCVNSTAVSAPGLTQDGDICNNLKLSIEEDNAVGGTPVSCLVGTPFVNACVPSTSTVALDTWLTGTQTTPVSLVTSLAPATPHYYKISLYLGNVGNAFQGRQAAFGLTWHLAG
jgi:predicted ribosomally synthesized peptide with SipW-like signal peptide